MSAVVMDMRLQVKRTIRPRGPVNWAYVSLGRMAASVVREFDSLGLKRSGGMIISKVAHSRPERTWEVLTCDSLHSSQPTKWLMLSNDALTLLFWIA